MMSRYKLIMLLTLLVIPTLSLGACTVLTPEKVVETVVVTQEVEVTKEVEVIKEVMVTPEPEPEGPKTLVVCQDEEPETLYLYGGDMLAARHIQHAIYDGPIDNRTYAYQPVIVEQLPNVGNDAVINAVTVQAGDVVVDSNGAPVELTEGTIVYPTNCRTAACAIEFDGTPLEMDQMVVTFALLEGISWSDGEPLTADDSVYGFELASDPNTPIAKYTVDRTSSYEAIDNTTVVWTGLPGYIDSQFFTNFWHPMPRHLWQDELDYEAIDLLDAEESSRTPIGWGAFVIKEWVANDHITVEKNPLYFRSGEGLPYIDTVVFRFVSDPNAAVAQLISGECDIVVHDTGLENQADLLLKLEQEGIVEPLFLLGTIWEHVDFGINTVADYNRPDFFEDVRMRQAIAYCLDRQRVVDTVLYGRSIVMDSYIPPEHPLHAGDRIVTYEYNPDKGIALLEEIGWLAGDDGIRVAQDVEGIPDGRKLAFKWQSIAASQQVAYMRIFQENLTECGFDITLENLPSGEYFARGPEGPLFGRSFDMSSFAWQTGVEPPCDLFLSELIPSEQSEWEGQNTPGFINEAYDVACKRALQSLPGTEDYIEGHKEAQRIFSEQLPTLPLFVQLKLAAKRPEVIGIYTDPTENSEMWNIEAFDLQ